MWGEQVGERQTLSYMGLGARAGLGDVIVGSLQHPNDAAKLVHTVPL